MRILIIITILLTSCSFSSDIESSSDQYFVEEILRPSLDSVIRFPNTTKNAILWRGSLEGGKFRKTFIENSPDSFRAKKNIEEKMFNNLKTRIYDSIKVSFQKGILYDSVLLIETLLSTDSISDYFILEVAASPLISKNNSGLIYIETTGLFHRNGRGLVCELKKINDKWSVNRVTLAWSLQNDSLRMGAYH